MEIWICGVLFCLGYQKVHWAVCHLSVAAILLLLHVHSKFNQQCDRCFTLLCVMASHSLQVRNILQRIDISM